MMALAARLAPEKFLGVGGAFGDPLLGSKHADFGRERFAGEIALGILDDADVRWMRGDVVLEFLHKKCVNDFGLVVGHAFVEVFVEGQKVAGGAGIGELHGQHALAARAGGKRFEGRRKMRHVVDGLIGVELIVSDRRVLR